MSGPKIFLIALFVIALLFVVSINLGATHADDATFSVPGWATGLHHTQPLQIGDLTSTPATCLQATEIVVPAGSTCLFTIQQSSFAERFVALQLIQGVSAVAKLTQENILPVQQSLSGVNAKTDASQMKVYPGKAHGMLSVECLAGTATLCLFKLQQA